MKRLFVLLAFLFFGLLPDFVNGQNQMRLDEIFSSNGEVYFRFEYGKTVDLHFLTNIISIDNITSDDWIYAYSDKKGFEGFLEQKIDYEILPHPGSLINPEMKSKVDIKSINDWDFYPTYEAYIDLMNQFEQDYPDLCDVFSIGTTVQGRQLKIAKLSANVNIQENEPRFLYTSSIHGDEITGYILMLRLIDYLLKNYNSDEQVTNLLKNMEIWINPLANPDGTYAGGNGSVLNAKRFNANNVDLNRNYPDPQNGPHPDGEAWQTETIEFMELADSVSFIMSANFHGGQEVFNYPWDTWSKLHPDDEWWKLVGREWADTVHANAPVGYFTYLNNGITNGYEWYEVNGGRQDYMNYFHHCREVTLEISNIKILPENLLPDYWDYNYRSFLNYMNQGLYGIAGIITDSGSGLPLKATVTVLDHDADGSWILSDSITGGYFRPLLEGSYSISYSAPNYVTQVFDQIEVINYQRTYQNVALVYSGAGTEEIAFSNNFMVGPNPVTEAVTITYLGNEAEETTISINDITGKLLIIQNAEFTTNGQKLKLPTGHLREGLYFVKISSSEFELVKKLIIK